MLGFLHGYDDHWKGGFVMINEHFYLHCYLYRITTARHHPLSFMARSGKRRCTRTLQMGHIWVTLSFRFRIVRSYGYLFHLKVRSKGSGKGSGVGVFGVGVSGVFSPNRYFLPQHNCSSTNSPSWWCRMRRYWAHSRNLKLKLRYVTFKCISTLWYYLTQCPWSLHLPYFTEWQHHTPYFLT